MKTDWFTKLALGIIALMLSVISLRPFLQTETVRAQAAHPQSTATPKKWAYLIILRTREFPRNETNGGMGFVYYDAGEWKNLYINGSDVGFAKASDMATILKAMGDQGWELVAVEPISSAATSGVQGGFSMAGATTDERWVFKRPIW